MPWVGSWLEFNFFYPILCVPIMILSVRSIYHGHFFQFCMAEKQDWRQCQLEVKEFRECVERNKTKPAEKTWVRGTGPYPRQLRLVDSRHPRIIRTRVVAGSSPSKTVVNMLYVNIFCTLFIYCYNIHFLVIYWFIFYIWKPFFITFIKSLMHICVNFCNGQELRFKE